MIVLRRRRTTVLRYYGTTVLRYYGTTVRRTEQNQAFDEEIAKRPEQLQIKR
jgi:hypothetical protein